MKLSSPLTELQGIGPVLAQKYERLGLSTVAELITYYPRRYADYSVISSASQLRPGPVTIEATIKQVKGRYARRGMHITEAVASDKNGSVRLIWFNQPYRATAIQPGMLYYISGVYELSHQRFAIMNPSMELVSEFPINTARIVPIYRETKGLTSRQLRQALQQLLPLIESLPETLPAWLLKEYGLLKRSDSIKTMHFPLSSQQLKASRQRLSFEEIFQLILASLLNKTLNQQQKAPIIAFDGELAKEFVAQLPFSLTDGQRRVIWQICLDLQKSEPMNRLIEGDVGSGKTVIATMVAAMVIRHGWQVALMAPTELLARQHAETISKLLQPLKMDQTVDLLVGSLSKAQKITARQAIIKGNAQFIIGTHALLQDSIDMHKLALVIIDEQHRFGVEQRQALQAKAGRMPHLLSLSATPIPRSLALTLYGELNITQLTDKPHDRLPIITKIVSPNSRSRLMGQLDKKLGAGKQMFVVCPVISPSNISAGHSAEKVFEQLGKHDFKYRRLGLLHGKMKPSQKEAVMKNFMAGKLDILVTTTVIGVGVDVPRATLMLIEDPEYFGLAQLHQLRGRIGRGSEQAYCYLMMADSSEPSHRLRALETSQDGFRLADLDLRLRGPGAIYGALQHGQFADLKVAQLSDIELIAKARHAAQKFITTNEDLLQYKELAARIEQLRTITNLN